MIISNQTALLNQYPLASARPAKARAAAQTDEAQITPSEDQLAVSENNFAAAIQDADAAKSSAEFVRKGILSQPGLAMLAQANSIPQSALRLLQP